MSDASAAYALGELLADVRAHPPPSPCRPPRREHTRLLIRVTKTRASPHGSLSLPSSQTARARALSAAAKNKPGSASPAAHGSPSRALKRRFRGAGGRDPEPLSVPLRRDPRAEQPRDGGRAARAGRRGGGGRGGGGPPRRAVRFGCSGGWVRRGHFGRGHFGRGRFGRGRFGRGRFGRSEDGRRREARRRGFGGVGRAVSGAGA